MDVTNKDEARAWLRAWRGKPTAGVLRAAIEGTELGISILQDGPTRDDARGALAVLRAADPVLALETVRAAGYEVSPSGRAYRTVTSAMGGCPVRLHPGHVECRDFLEAHGIQLDHVHPRDWIAPQVPPAASR